MHYFHSWRPAEEPRDIYKKRMIALLEAYLDEMESFAQERRLEKTKVIKSAEPFKWLAMWWFCDYRTFQELADDVHVTRQAATLAIQRAAEKCGLHTPKGEVGRPGSAGKPAKK